MADSARIHLTQNMFTEKEWPLVEYGALTASVFRYDSGVCGLRIQNTQGQIVALPFQGQQIWSAEFNGRNITMRSMFTNPRATTEYLANYGAFLVHCGATAMGVPGEGDKHPLHGELPHAPYVTAYVEIGEDEQGAYLGLGGQYQHTIAFSVNYSAEPFIKLYANSGLIWISMTIRNLKQTEMELMYMAHANFRPVDHGRLVYSAPATPEYVRVRPAAPHLNFKPGYNDFIADLVRNPAKHHVLEPGTQYDPEAVLYIDYLADADGWAHSMQVHPDGSADYIRHRPGQLDHGVRWISRTPDQEALGIVLPATAGAEGYTIEKAKGNIKVLPPKGEFYCEVVAGVVDASQAQRIENQIAAILAQ